MENVMQDSVKNALPPLMETVTRSKEFIAELADASLKSEMNVKILEEVPILKWAVKAYNFQQLYQQIKLTRNCEAFLQAVKDVDTGNINILETMFNENPDALDTLLAVLFDSAKPMKCEIIGKLIKASGEISSTDFDTLSLLLLSASIPALRALDSFFKESEGNYWLHRANIHSEPMLLSMGVSKRHGSKFEVSKLGCLLYKCGMAGDISSLPY
jgi:hypothetical protein